MDKKITIITGGSLGVGRNSAMPLGQRGVDVILTHRSRKAEAESLTAEIEQLGDHAGGLQLDMGDSGSFAEVPRR